MSSRTRIRWLLLLVLPLLVRAAIPDGYMPAGRDKGLLFELCPSGLPSGFIAAISGSHHHHGADHGAQHLDLSSCEIGHMLSFAVVFGDIRLPEVVPQAEEVIAAGPHAPVCRTPQSLRSRDPPA